MKIEAPRLKIVISSKKACCSSPGPVFNVIDTVRVTTPVNVKFVGSKSRRNGRTFLIQKYEKKLAKFQTL